MNKEKQIRVLLVRPGQYPEERMVDNTLPALQKLVDGDIETVSPWPDRVCIVCDDEGKLKGKPFNRTLGESPSIEPWATTMCWRGIFLSAASRTVTFAA